MGAIRAALVIAIALLVVGPTCSRLESNDQVYPYTEMVIPIGDTVSAINPNGKIVVTAKSTTFRRYRWDDGDATSGLNPRPRRWYGSLGIYKVRNMFFGQSANFEEAQIHFPDERSALRWLTAGQDPPLNVVWNKSGLMVGFDHTPAFNQIDVDVMQVCIRGRKPNHLSGAVDGVTITGPDGRPVSTLPCANPGPVYNDGPS